MSLTGQLDTDAAALLTAARRGDNAAFQALVAPHLRALHLHCYRLLGSYHDAEDALQDSLLRAWRGLDGYAGRAPLRHWLYRITTTSCLKLINKRGRLPASAADVAHLQPYPDALLGRLPDTDADPAAIADRRDTVALAFVAALQLLPAAQRAVLILREVLAFSARETADVLDLSVPAVNSALQRARASLAGQRAAPDPGALGEREQRVLQAFLRAWRACDIPALAAVLRDDVVLTMPPQSIRIVGRSAVVEFFATVPADGRLELIRLAVTRANGHPAVAAYLPDDTGACRGYGLMVLTTDGEAVTSITGFPDPELFGLFDLPDVWG